MNPALNTNFSFFFFYDACLGSVFWAGNDMHLSNLPIKHTSFVATTHKPAFLIFLFILFTFLNA